MTDMEAFLVELAGADALPWRCAAHEDCLQSVELGCACLLDTQTERKFVVLNPKWIAAAVTHQRSGLYKLRMIPKPYGRPDYYYVARLTLEGLAVVRAIVDLKIAEEDERALLAEVRALPDVQLAIEELEQAARSSKMRIAS